MLGIFRYHPPTWSRRSKRKEAAKTLFFHVKNRGRKKAARQEGVRADGPRDARRKLPPVLGRTPRGTPRAQTCAEHGLAVARGSQRKPQSRIKIK